MPKFPKGFGRRKTLAPPENQPDGSARGVEPSFKVFDRAQRVDKSFDGGVRLSKSTPTTIGRVNNILVEDDNLFENARGNHSSGASNTLTSTTDNSSRLSATSTALSSTDNVYGHEWSSPHDKPFTDIPPPPAPRKSSTFLTTNTSGAPRGKQVNLSNKELPPSPSNQSDEEGSRARMRAVTMSSNASTTVPAKCHEKDRNDNFSGQFSQIMSNFERNKGSAQNSTNGEKRPESQIPPEQSRSYPAPLSLVKSKKPEVSPDSWSGQDSSEWLINSVSPPPVASRHSPRSPLVPHHISHPTTNTSPPYDGDRIHEKDDNAESDRKGINRNQSVEYEIQDLPIDEDAQLLQESINASRRLNEQSLDEQNDTSFPHSPSRTSHGSRWTSESMDKLEGRKAVDRDNADNNIFNSTIAARANLAQRYQERSLSPPTGRKPHTKIMTPAQFERYKLDQDKLRNLRINTAHAEGDDDEAYDDDGDDEDELEKAKAVAKQRRKQEAHMAVYRQQMMKVIGETPGHSVTRPNVYSSQSSPNLTNFGNLDEGEEEDEEVPLGILQAHGFPSKNKPPPMRNIGSNPNLKVAAGSATMNGMSDQRLPIFARNLPHDPYYGSGIVKPMHRESMAFAGGSSANNGGMKGLPLGGLVGVIATEERSRAMRRGSPNAQNDFPVQAPHNSQGMGQSSNEIPGILSKSTAPPIILTPVDQAQIKMTQQMQDFMKMQMQFMQMMAQGPPQSPGNMPHPSEIPRPASAQLHQRSHTMMNHKSAPWLNRASTYTPSMYGGNGYTPSIAPSERSNVGLPGRYRPVSQAPVISQNKIRTSTMCGTTQTWDEKKSIRPNTAFQVLDPRSGHISDEDEDEAWSKMAEKKKEKKSIWRTKKDRDSNGLKEMLNYLN